MDGGASLEPRERMSNHFLRPDRFELLTSYGHYSLTKSSEPIPRVETAVQPQAINFG